MKNRENGNTFGQFAVLAGLWLINILIVIFSLPILIFKKLRGAFSKKNKNLAPVAPDEKRSHYFPCGSNPKLLISLPFYTISLFALSIS